MEGGQIAAASVAMTNLADTPVFSEAAGAALVGTSGDEATRAEATTAGIDDIDPQEDMRGPIAFKKHVAGVILRRAIDRAIERAG